MKRIFSILAVVCLIVSLAVPTFAASTHTVSGKWVFNQQLTLPTQTIGQTVNFTYGSITCKTMSVRSDAIGFLYTKDNGETWKSYNYYTLDGGWAYPDTVTVDFGTEPQTVSDSFYTWLLDNATPPPCDGTCAVPDSNLDGVCDSCGFPFALRATTYAYTHSVTFKTSSGGYIKADFYSDEEFTIRGYKYGNSYRVEPSIAVMCKAWSSPDAVTWEETYTGLVANYYPTYNLDDSVVVSTFNWYESSTGDLFFPLPLWVEMDKVTQGEITTGGQAVHGAMMTLAVCGIGCLALLVVLKLFGKRSLIFRS